MEVIESEMIYLFMSYLYSILSYT